MKIEMIVCSALTAALLTGCINIENEGQEDHNKCEKCEKYEKGEHHGREAKQAKLMSEAKVSKEAAGQIALAKVPNGTIQEAEIEKEHGKLVWSFDVATPDAKDITEVNVDAVTGEVVSVEKESVESEAKEAAGEKDKDNDKD